MQVPSTHLELVKKEAATNGCNCRYINLSTSRSIDEIGKGGMVKWFLNRTIKDDPSGLGTCTQQPAF